MNGVHFFAENLISPAANCKAQTPSVSTKNHQQPVASTASTRAKLQVFGRKKAYAKGSIPISISQYLSVSISTATILTS
jgi:hypothetical protein